MIRLGAALCFATIAAHAAGAAPTCEAAAALAERMVGTPPGLLAAIGRVEAGRRDAGVALIWPWTINAHGQGVFLANGTDAVAHAGLLLNQGVRSIDVGCFQVNLGWHPDAFASLAEAFDPVANALYAARYLVSLQGIRGDWADAVARYHSATPELGQPYRTQVFARWNGAMSAGGGAHGVHVFYGAIRMPAP